MFQPLRKPFKHWSLLALPLAAMALGGTSAAQAQDWQPTRAVEYIAPANPGGGWDTLVRTMANVIRAEKLSEQSFAAINIPGGGGAVAWAQIARDDKNDNKLFATSPPIILVPLAGTSRFSHKDFTPIARISTDYSIVLVRADSPYQTIGDLFAAIEANPGLSVGGGSAAGSMDHIAIAGAAAEAGLEPRQVNYIAFSGGGEAMISLMGKHVEAVIGGAGESVGQLQGGELRAIAVSSPERLTGALADVPTFKEQGYDYTFDIWRGVMAPKHISAEARTYYEKLFARMMETDSWKQASTQLGWLDAYQNSAEFGAFLDQQQAQFSSVLGDLGLLKR
ncbi:tripartite tricarboxylate transporter substrate binding protein [Zobellella aerophila]|uniref:Tripartite tricarboxylate transporter substrate binding protein n=1 Tax=Zobellella aerophila TaxID=870480 RepID=A0ABP6V1R4_9GAMM